MLDRAWYDALVDDDGSGQTGSFWDKAAIDGLLDAIDALRLDQLAAPTDVTTLNATTSAHGLLPKLPGGTTTFLRADGTFATPSAGTPSAHATTHEPGGSDAMVVDAAAGTGSLRTLGTSATSAAAGNDSRLSDARTPTAHAATHKSGGSDAVKLDEFAAPTDVTTLNATTSAHGLLPKLPGGTTTFLRADGTFATPAGGEGGTSAGIAALCPCRLTATSGVPVTRSDVSGATSIYVTPFGGNEMGLYDGAAWNARTFAELTQSLAGLTASKVYDLFAYDNAGTVTLEVSAAWSSATARFSSGPYATLLPIQNGVPVKSTDGTAIDATRRYLGSFYINASGGQTDDTVLKRYVWNYYNRVRRPMRRLETTASWTYTTAADRQANGSTSNQLDLVVGVAEVMVEITLATLSSNTSANVERRVGIGEDSASPMSGVIMVGTYSGNWPANQVFAHAAHLRHQPAIGRHFYTWTEKSSATGTTTWYGTPVGNDFFGMVGSIEG